MGGTFDRAMWDVPSTEHGLEGGDRLGVGQGIELNEQSECAV